MGFLNLVAFLAPMGFALACGAGSEGLVMAPAALDGFKLHGREERVTSVTYRGTLSDRDPFLRYSALGDAYSFFGQAGELLTATQQSSEVDSYLVLLDGEGRVLAENDDADWTILASDNYTDAGFLYRLPVDGLYFLVCSSYGSERGRYELEVTRAGFGAPLEVLQSDTWVDVQLGGNHEAVRAFALPEEASRLTVECSGADVDLHLTNPAGVRIDLLVCQAGAPPTETELPGTLQPFVLIAPHRSLASATAAQQVSYSVRLFAEEE